MKCEACKNNIETGFLEKLKGGYVKDEKGKKHAVCSHCQKKFQKKDELLKNLTK